eukprot:CAMPEP_0194279560 /NCGR_PEP_ID=MMETSP0169-20130528/13998_1 /TAXON_ID=218684 /ORGANISM="Corethron pennatum, Strain L29A3" /LENGTH=253 /DNA_ID=CAMNT_0039024001 /DNA_START=51 /DNA_END=812 /DNA_ORIENTATION=+
MTKPAFCSLFVSLGAVLRRTVPVDGFSPYHTRRVSSPTIARPASRVSISTHCRHWQPVAPRRQPLGAALDISDSGTDDEKEADAASVAVISDGTPPDLSRAQRLKMRLFPPKKEGGLTFKQQMAKAGLSVALSYGWVSNVSYSVTVSLAWYIFSKRKGLSPLAPGQWKGFLAIYAGFYVFNNIIRPLRFGASVAVAAYFDEVVRSVQEKFRVRKGVAIFLTVFLFNVVGTCALMAAGIFLASTAAGVPIFPPK